MEGTHFLAFTMLSALSADSLLLANDQIMVFNLNLYKAFQFGKEDSLKIKELVTRFSNIVKWFGMARFVASELCIAIYGYYIYEMMLIEATIVTMFYLSVFAAALVLSLVIHKMYGAVIIDQLEQMMAKEKNERKKFKMYKSVMAMRKQANMEKVINSVVVFISVGILFWMGLTMFTERGYGGISILYGLYNLGRVALLTNNLYTYAVSIQREEESDHTSSTNPEVSNNGQSKTFSSQKQMMV